MNGPRSQVVVERLGTLPRGDKTISVVKRATLAMTK